MAHRIIHKILREAHPTPLATRQIWEAIAAEPAYLEVIPSKAWLKRKLIAPMATQQHLLRTKAKKVTAKQRKAGEGAAKWQTHPKLLVKQEKRALAEAAAPVAEV